MSNRAVSTHLVSEYNDAPSWRACKAPHATGGEHAKHHMQQSVHVCHRLGARSTCSMQGQCMQHGVVLGVQVPIYGVAVAHASASQRPNFTELPGV